MEPTIKNGSIVVISSIPYFFLKPKVGDIIALKNNKKILIKRIKTIHNQKIFIEGDNKNDNLEIGWIEETNIIGKILYIF